MGTGNQIESSHIMESERMTWIMGNHSEHEALFMNQKHLRPRERHVSLLACVINHIPWAKWKIKNRIRRKCRRTRREKKWIRTSSSAVSMLRAADWHNLRLQLNTHVTHRPPPSEIEKQTKDSIVMPHEPHEPHATCCVCVNTPQSAQKQQTKKAATGSTVDVDTN